MKNILLVCDVHNWSWGRMCQGIKEHAPDWANVEIVDQVEFGAFNSNYSVLNKYDGISQCSWAESSTNLPFKGKMTAWVASHGHEYPYPPKNPKCYQAKIATKYRNSVEASKRFDLFHSLLCVSDRILSGFESTERRNVERVVPGVSWKWTENTPVRNEREVPVIGWCGQRRGVTKGYDEVLVPVMEKLGDSVEWEINSRDHTNALGEEEMIRWYDDIDIFLSTSSSEGYQMPALEAMSRGRMVIATDAGGAGELISASAGGVLVDSWSNRKDAIPVVGQICDTITHNWENRHQFGDLGYDYVRLHQSWETLAEEWLEEIVF